MRDAPPQSVIVAGGLSRKGKSILPSFHEADYQPIVSFSFTDVPSLREICAYGKAAIDQLREIIGLQFRTKTGYMHDQAERFF